MTNRGEITSDTEVNHLAIAKNESANKMRLSRNFYE